jgi:hypothetical protein
MRMKAIMQLVIAAPRSAVTKLSRSSPPLNQDGADDADDQEHRGQEQRQRPHLLAPVRHGFGRRHAVLVHGRPYHHIGGEHRRQQDAGADAGEEESRDRLFGRRAVDDHDDRGRNEEAEGAGAGERADGEPGVVAALLQFRQRHAPDGGGRRGGGAGNAGEQRAAEDVDMQQPAGQPARERREALEHVGGQPRAKQDLAHPDEHRQRGQVPAVHRAPDAAGEDGADRGRGGDLHRHEADSHQREADPQAAKQQPEQHRHEQKRKKADIHVSGLPRRLRDGARFP